MPASILAVTTLQTPGANATVVNSAQAINLLAGTAGHTIINNSGTIEGDVLFNSGGGGNTLNVGNVGDVTNPNDTTGNANSAITTVQGTAVANTPFNYATLTGRIDGTISGAPPVTETNIHQFRLGHRQFAACRRLRLCQQRHRVGAGRPGRPCGQ